MQRHYMGRDKAASPSAEAESIILNAIIDAKEQQDVRTEDIPNAFVPNGKERNIRADGDKNSWTFSGHAS
jgi:hypothetical protein